MAVESGSSAGWICSVCNVQIAIDFFAVTNAQNQNYYLSTVDFINDAIIAHAKCIKVGAL